MNKKLSLLAAFPLIAAGALVGTGSAQAGLITPPPPDGQFAFSPIVITGQDAGATFFLRNNGVLPPVTGTFSGACGTAECSFFDFKPPTGGDIGRFKVDNRQPDPGPFSGIATGTEGEIKDLLLPFLGAPIDNPNLNVPLPITAFLDLDPTGGDDVIDTFDVTQLRGFTFGNIGSGSFVSAAFDGVWNVETPDGIEQFAGSVTLSQALVQNVSQVLSAARAPGGFTASYSGQGDITGVVPVPEPATLAGLALVAGSVAMMRKRQKS